MFGKKKSFGFYSFIFGLGAVTGAFAALLYAPKPGRKFQKQVKEVLEDQFDNVQNVVKKVVNS
jgi:gas vesicle protein